MAGLNRIYVSRRGVGHCAGPWAWVVLLLPLTGAASAQPSEQTASTAATHTSALGFYYSRGGYGESSETRIRFLPFSHEVARGSWRFKATVPVLEISGPANVLVNVGSVGGFSDSRVSASGAGDISFNLTYEVPAWSADAPFIDISADFKAPTADPKQGLGSGRMDAGLQIDLYQLAGPLTVFASAGYRYRRPSPFYPGLENSLFGSVGASANWGDTLQYGLIYDYRQAASSFTGETHELLPYLSWAMSADWSVMLYTVTGFTEDSADFAAGMQLSRRW
ncbi:MAG: transporter [Pseudohongiella sp.]|uniref:transporter n=1 Tax=Pseudohongiella sp. TaxID=1979412 RepID=UPI0034A06E0B